MNTMLAGSVRYELLMAARGRVLWIATLPLLIVVLLVGLISPTLATIDTAAGVVIAETQLITLFSVLGIAVGLADRFARTHRRTGLPELLDTTGASPTLRMVGSLGGSLATALAPVAVTVLAVGGYVAADRGSLLAVVWAAAAFAGITVPAALLAVTLAATLGLLVPIPLARLITLVVWGWATLLNQETVPMLPTVNGSLASPLGDYVAHGWLHAPRFAPSGVSAISPPATPITAGISLTILLTLAAAMFGLARAVVAIRIPKGN